MAPTELKGRINSFFPSPSQNLTISTPQLSRGDANATSFYLLHSVQGSEIFHIPDSNDITMVTIIETLKVNNDDQAPGRHQTMGAKMPNPNPAIGFRSHCWGLTWKKLVLFQDCFGGDILILNMDGPKYPRV